MARRRGVQEPSFALVPKHAQSEGGEACALAAGYDMKPDKWQRIVLEGWLATDSKLQWAASDCGCAVPRQNGKNAILEFTELYLSAIIGMKILHTAHEVKTCRKHFLRMKYYFENARKFPELSELVTYIRATNGQEAIVLKNGGSIEFIARSKSSGRGFTVDVLVCDEAQELTDEQMEAIQPAISSAPSGNPLTIYTGTPTPPTSPGTVFARMRRNAHRDKPPKNLCWFEWAATEIGDVHDQQRWYQYNPSLGTRLLKSVVVSESEKMTPDGFARERLGWWNDQAGALSDIDVDEWAKCKTDNPCMDGYNSYAVKFSADGATVDAPPITAAGDLIDSDLIDFDATLASHPINHLICLGKGELKDRIVVHWYADQKGTLSHTQTIKGADERASVYELSNADAAELETKGKTKLQELRDTGSIDVDVTGGIDLDVTGGIDLDVGDTVTGRDNTTGIRVTAEITKKIIKVKDGIPTVTYEATTASTESTGETGGGGSSSGDGHAYYAGSGLTLSNWTFSADVTAADLETVRRTATEANKAASDAAAEIGGARDLAKQAGVKADTATTTAQNALAAAQARILDITASAPVTVTRNDETAAITVAQATSSADGLMAAADKKKLDGIQSAANKYTLPVASTATLGGVKPDGRTITVGPDGTITAQSSATEASFLAAHPIGSLYWCVAGNPNDHGGTWKEIHTIIGGHVWQRLA